MTTSQRASSAPAPNPPPRHIAPERLALHAAGQLRAIERVVIEAHLAFCGDCMGTLGELLEPGARWLRELAAEPPPASVWERLERRLDAGPGSLSELAVTPAGTELVTSAGGLSTIAIRDAGLPGAALPLQAWEEIPDPKPALGFRPVYGTSARYAVLATDPEADTDLLMIGLGGGRAFPEHLHLGNEEVVILAGGYTDEITHLDAGDYFHYPPGSSHRTVTDAGEACWTVGMIQHGVRFRGVFGVLQWLFDPLARARYRRYRSVHRG